MYILSMSLYLMYLRVWIPLPIQPPDGTITVDLTCLLVEEHSFSILLTPLYISLKEYVFSCIASLLSGEK